MMSSLSSMPIDSRTTSGSGAGLDLLRIAELAVRGRCRMNHQRAGVADIGQMRGTFLFDTSLTPAS